MTTNNGKEEFVSLTMVREMLNIQRETIISFFKETISDFNGRLDKVFADLHDLKTSQTFQGDDFKDKHKVICSMFKLLKKN